MSYLKPGETAASITREAFGICPPKSKAEELADAQRAAHAALDAAERAWYAYAGMVDVGPDRTRAFEVYENVRNARWV